MSKSIILHLQEVLSKDRLDILPNLEVFRARGFYLAGGTALSLIFGHRESEDFDFFTGEDFDPWELFSFCQNHFPGRQVENILEAENTLWITVDAIKMSFFVLKRPMLEPLIETPYFNIASVRDIGVMKLAAIQHRATIKDYIDIAYILRTIELDLLIKDFKDKYGEIIAKPQLLKSLIYFADINIDWVRMLTDNYNWNQIQKELEKRVKECL